MFVYLDIFFNFQFQLSYHIYGPSSFHAVNLINNFGAACILRNRFETARKYLEIGIERILHVNECADIIVGYYCNYAGEIDPLPSYNYLQRPCSTVAKLTRHSSMLRRPFVYLDQRQTLSRSTPSVSTRTSNAINGEHGRASFHSKNSRIPSTFSPKQCKYSVVFARSLLKLCCCFI